tara:strand:- start:326 stop:1018 length:693 start_codon:yes stop_codon:yes gene_type:complete
MLVAFANLLSQVGNEKIFKNLYSLRPDNFVCFLSSNFINLFALFGILWQCLEYSKSTGNVTQAVIYGAMLFIIAFPFARNGLNFVLENVDYYLREKTELTYEYNWHLLVFGLLYIIFLLGFQAIILALLDSTSSRSQKKKISEPKVKPRVNEPVKPKVENKKLETKAEPKPEPKTPKKNNVNKLLKNSTLSNVSNLSKYLNNSSPSNSGSKSSSTTTKKRKVTRRLVPIN